MRFKVNYLVGRSIREDIIEAEDLDQAEIKANERRPSWVDIKICNINQEV